ncbi:hypothetical protein B9T19_01075 [Ignatzschineria sp. F8392]|uniref:DNA polymerase III subunit chi n=1 Tax=Ignatzschineria sp. F8392 TaxID=1980117 RepID=UPI000B9868A5|nr:DNA polymerase III subunit chi [Ignatzschineria sp. F8392]OYQ81302.1 hypothetical protein B9T19_01075 [Ignatzschineria sp. F8392]
MVQVSFYVLPTSNEASRQKLLLKILEKAYLAEEPALLYSDNQELIRFLDRKLWELPHIEFLPHAVITTEEDINEADFIYLSDKMWPLPHRSLIINIHPFVPDDVKNGLYQRVFEVITQDPQVLEESRNRYRLYRQLGFEIETHKL